MAKYGPSKREHQLRLAVSVVGLCLVAIAIWRMEAFGPAAFEALVIGGAFMGGSAVWSGLKLCKKDFGEN